MTTFFSGPTAHPGAPCAVLAEHPLDRSEVVRQVVLGEEIDQQCAAHFGPDLVTAEVGVVGRPLVPGLVISPTPIGDQIVGEPLLGGRQMALEECLRNGRELVQDLGFVHVDHPTDQ